VIVFKRLIVGARAHLIGHWRGRPCTWSCEGHNERGQSEAYVYWA